MVRSWGPNMFVANVDSCPCLLLMMMWENAGVVDESMDGFLDEYRGDAANVIEVTHIDLNDGYLDFPSGR